MASQAIGDLAAASGVHSPAVTDTDDEKPAVAGNGAITADVTPKLESDIESTDDGLRHQYIEKDGRQVLVSWTKDEEARVVRKADFLFLPLFAVIMSETLFGEL